MIILRNKNLLKNNYSVRKKRRKITQNEKKMEHYKISKWLNDSTVSKFVTKICVEVNGYQVVNILSTKVQALKLQC